MIIQSKTPQRDGEKSMGFGVSHIRVKTQSISCETSGKLPNLSGPQILHLVSTCWESCEDEM